MRSLNWKLSGALLLIVAISVGLTAWLMNLRTTSEFQQYLLSGNMMYNRTLADSLGDLYLEEQSWDAVQDSLDTMSPSPSQRVVVADNKGIIVGDSTGEWLGRQAAEIGLSGGTAISVSGQNAGTLYLLTTAAGGRGRMGGRTVSTVVTAEDDFLDSFRNSLWIVTLITAAVALVVGLVLTRQITRPVRALIAGVRRLAKGELDYRVEVRSHDEIGELADSFNSMATNLEKIEQSRQQLTADITHELRTPLTIIEGTVDGIIDGVFTADSEHLHTIKEQTGTLTNLIGDLRDISLAESGQLKLKRTQTNISELVNRVVSSHQVHLREKGISLELQDSSSKSELYIDPLRMEQVLTNLLTNAIRHTPSGGTISVSVSERADSLELSVADTGEGIAPEDLPHVFERFYRSGDSRTRREGGTGLGLAIVKQMVEIHGGTVGAKSTPGQGSTFTFSLPVRTE